MPSHRKAERCGGGESVGDRNDLMSFTAERCGVGRHLGRAAGLVVAARIQRQLPQQLTMLV